MLPCNSAIVVHIFYLQNRRPILDRSLIIGLSDLPCREPIPVTVRAASFREPFLLRFIADCPGPGPAVAIWIEGVLSQLKASSRAKTVSK
jgi:hypothetical protein